MINLLLVAMQVADVLRVVVPHWGPHTLDIQDACNLLQVSRRCRNTLQHTRGQFRVWVSLYVDRPAAGLARLIGFLAWLPKHAGLISHVEVYMDPPPADDRDPAVQLLSNTVSDAVGMALKLCAAEAAMGAAVGGGGTLDGGEDNGITAPGSRESLALPLHLECLLINTHPTPSLLRALGATDISSLHLDLAREDATPAVCSAFSSLSSLLDLSISQVDDPDAVPLQLVQQGLQSLTSLTSLALRFDADAAVYLPASLRSLK